MEANMNPNSIVPLYVQVVECLKRDIENGVYNATGRIPTEAELAEQYKVSRITIRRAVDDLVSQGLVEKKQGKGTDDDHILMSIDECLVAGSEESQDREIGRASCRERV